MVRIFKKLVFQLAELHHHLSKTASGIETGGALNLSQNHQDGSTAHNHQLQQQQQQHHQLQGNQQQNWMQQSDYFGSGSGAGGSGAGGSGSQFPFAHWMSMGLDQPPTMVPNTYSFGQGLRSELDDHNSRSYTPGLKLSAIPKKQVVHTADIWNPDLSEIQTFRPLDSGYIIMQPRPRLGWPRSFH